MQKTKFFLFLPATSPKIKEFSIALSFTLFFSLILLPKPSIGAINKQNQASEKYFSNKKGKKKKWNYKKAEIKAPIKYRMAPPIFDFPITYNSQVKKWIRYYQSKGRYSFKRWLERSARYAPYIRRELEKHKMPKDLLYVAMIESGFFPVAKSHAGAKGLWQFVAPTGRRYGLKINWWLDERNNFTKSTTAAIRYKRDLYKQFKSWHLVSASYNTGEGRIARLIKKYKTNSFWKLAEKKVIANETINYVPKIIAAILIAKSPALYGFRNLNFKVPFKFETMKVPGGVDLINLANYIGVKASYLKALNPELIQGFIPREVPSHQIKIPIGSRHLVREYSALVTKYPKI